MNVRHEAINQNCPTNYSAKIWHSAQAYLLNNPQKNLPETKQEKNKN